MADEVTVPVGAIQSNKPASQLGKRKSPRESRDNQTTVNDDVDGDDTNNMTRLRGLEKNRNPRNQAGPSACLGAIHVDGGGEESGTVDRNRTPSKGLQQNQGVEYQSVQPNIPRAAAPTNGVAGRGLGKNIMSRQEPTMSAQNTNPPSPEKNITVTSFRLTRAPNPPEVMRDQTISNSDTKARERFEAWVAPTRPGAHQIQVAQPENEEQDEEEKEEKTGRRVLIAMGVASLVIIVVVVIASGVFSTGNDDSKQRESTATSPPTTPPTTAPLVDIDTTLIPGLEDSTWKVMQDPTSPQYKAYSWIVKDPILEMYEEWQLRQRFALAVFYYAMNGERWGDDLWLDYTSDECQWLTDPNTCYEEQIRYLNIPQQRRFKGSLPLELNLLTNLQGLDLSDNFIGGNLTELFGDVLDHPSLNAFWCSRCRLGGRFPAELSKMENLHRLFLNENEITGVLPPEVDQMTTLQALEVNGNLLTGSIPSTIGNLQLLEVLKLKGNRLESLPTEVGLMSALRVLDLGENQIKGTIPTELGLVGNLTRLFLESNALTGTVSEELNALTNLRYFWLDHNDLDGTISFSVGNLVFMRSIDWGYNSFTGPIPTEFGLMTDLFALGLTSNILTGNIPSSIGQMTSMQLFDCSVNQLKGSLPSEFGLMKNLKSLHLGSNKLTGSIPKEIGGLSHLNSFVVHGNPHIARFIPEGLCDDIHLLHVSTEWCDDKECCG